MKYFHCYFHFYLHQKKSGLLIINETHPNRILITGKLAFIHENEIKTFFFHFVKAFRSYQLMNDSLVTKWIMVCMTEKLFTKWKTVFNYCSTKKHDENYLQKLLRKTIKSKWIKQDTPALNLKKLALVWNKCFTNYYVHAYATS